MKSCVAMAVLVSCLMAPATSGQGSPNAAKEGKETMKKVLKRLQDQIRQSPTKLTLKVKALRKALEDHKGQIVFDLCSGPEIAVTTPDVQKNTGPTPGGDYKAEWKPSQKIRVHKKWCEMIEKPFQKEFPGPLDPCLKLDLFISTLAHEVVHTGQVGKFPFDTPKDQSKFEAPAFSEQISYLNCLLHEDPKYATGPLRLRLQKFRDAKRDQLSEHEKRLN